MRAERRDFFVCVGKSYPELVAWALFWLRRIGEFDCHNRQRLRRQRATLVFILAEAASPRLLSLSSAINTCRNVVFLPGSWYGINAHSRFPRTPSGVFAMKPILASSLAVCLMLFAVPRVDAGGVTVKKAHVCCGACVTAVKKTLGDLEGITNGTASQKDKTITFDAADDAAAQRGIEALAKAGFHGTATHGDKALAYPKTKAKEGDVADSLTFTGVHLCCKQCEVGAKAALVNVKNVKAITVDTKTKTVTITGEKVDVLEAIAAFNDGGFHGNLKDEKAE
jgi:copper chaperone CopZ